MFKKTDVRRLCMDNMNIYYFSGTGNSLYVAKELQKKNA